MTKEQFTNYEETEMVKGQFTKAKWQSVKTIDLDTYAKVSNGVVRFVAYENISSVEVKGQANGNEKHESQFLIHNDKTNRDYVQMATTNVKPQVTYYRNGVEITKDEYEMAIPPRKPRLDANGQPMATPIFRVFVENLLEIGNAD